jgi:O-antigen/teichoic acid export membrane protein
MRSGLARLRPRDDRETLTSRTLDDPVGRRLLRPALIYAATNAVAAGVPLLMLPVLTRVLTPDEYGKAAMYSVVVSLLGAFVGVNVHSSISVRFFEPDRAGLSRYVSTCLAILVVTSVVIFALVGLTLPWLEGAAKIPGTWLLTAVFVAAATFVVQTQLVIWQSAIRPWAYGAMRLLQATLDGSGSLMFVLMLGLGWQGRAGGITAAALTCAVIAFALLRRGAWVRFEFDSQAAHNALRFGIPLIPHVVGGMLIAMADRVMISNVLDTASTGVYMVALQIGAALGLATDSFNRAYAPWLLQALNQGSTRDVTIVRFTYLYFVIVILVAVALGLGAPAVLGLLVGEQFREAAPIVFYVALGFAFGGMYYMVTNYVFFARRIARLAAVTITCGLLNVALCYWLLRRHGLVGAAQAYMLAQAALFLATWWLAQRSRPMPWRRALLATP